MKKIFLDNAWEDLHYWINNNRKIVDKIYKLLQSIERDGAMKGEGKPERLKHDNSYSRKIDETNRLVYEIEGQ